MSLTHQHKEHEDYDHQYLAHHDLDHQEFSMHPPKSSGLGAMYLRKPIILGCEAFIM